MISLVNLWCFTNQSSEFFDSKLYDETTFYKQFRKDLECCKSEVIIESPFITSHRMYSLRSTFEKLVHRKVKVYVFTRHPEEHDAAMKQQADEAIRFFEMMGVQVVITNDYHHRKLAIIDRKILWEGSLNILSQTCSKEIMRRIPSPKEATQMFRFTKMDKFIY